MVISNLWCLSVTCTHTLEHSCWLQIIECGRSRPLQHLLDYGGNPNLTDKNGLTPLHVAVRMGDSWATSLLLERGARIDAIDKVGVACALWAWLSHPPPAGWKDSTAYCHSQPTEGASGQAHRGRSRDRLSGWRGKVRVR